MVIEIKQGDKFVKIPYITADVAVTEAPIDDKQYARKNANWSEVVIPEVDLTEVNNKIQDNTNAIANKVDKVTGKQLSTEDYTTVEKAKLGAIPAPNDIVITSDSRLTAATQSKDGIMTAVDKTKLDNTLLSTEVDTKINQAVASVYRVKEPVANYASLPTTGVVVGDVHNVEDTGANYVATSSDPVIWDKLSETVDLTAYSTTVQNDAKYQVKGDYATNTQLTDGLATKIDKSSQVILTETEYTNLGDVVNSDNKLYFIKEA